jgi:acetyl-CoA acetyltransferase
MEPVYLLSVGMTPFGQFPARSLDDLTRQALWEALDDASLSPRDLQIAYLGNSFAGMLQGQESARAVTILRRAGLDGIGMVHVETGSASSTMAMHAAWLAVGSGMYDIALAVGVEKLHIPGDPTRSIEAIASSSERFVTEEMGLTAMADIWMGIQHNMERYGWTRRDLARVAAKSLHNASVNPRAEVRQALGVEEILAARRIVGEITRPMCASASVDGASAAILCSERVAHRYTGDRIKVSAMAVTGARWMSEAEREASPQLLTMDQVPEVFAAAYEQASIGPAEIELAQCHDAIAAEELIAYQAMGFCAPGEGPRLVADGVTAVGGAIPTNTDGGLVGRGHPIGATGLAQVCEAFWQMKERAGARQVRHAGRAPRTAAIQNAGAQAITGGSGVGVNVAMILERG